MTLRALLVPGKRGARPSTCPWKTTLLCLAAVMPSVMAQNILTPPPSSGPLLPPAVLEYQTNQASQMQVFAPAETAPPQPAHPFTLGPVAIHPHPLYQFLYGNGIESSPGETQNTIVQEFSPGVLFDIGPHWSLDYTPTLIFYSSSQFRNAVDESVLLSWGSAFRNWFVSGSQSYASTSEPFVEIGGQTEEDTYSTTLSASYKIGQKLSLDLGFNQNFDYFNTGQSPTNLLLGLANSRVWSTLDWLNYQFRPRLTAGLGIGFGYNQQQDSPDSIDEQYQAQLNWRATDKTSFQLSGGLEDQQYLSGDASSLLTPIFAATVQYQPFAQTRISVGANRTVSTGDFQDQTVESTTVTCDFNQRLLGRLFFDLSGSYTSDKYVAALAGLSTGRSDNIYTMSPRLTIPFLKRGTASVFYEYSQDSSSQTGFAAGSAAFAYATHQVGFEIGYTY